MRRRFGVERTPEAVRRHAYRIGAPILEYEICPSCGGKHDHLGKDGVCYMCHQKLLAESERRKGDAIREELRRNGSAEERRKAEREYDRERARNARLRKRLRADG